MRRSRSAPILCFGLLAAAPAACDGEIAIDEPPTAIRLDLSLAPAEARCGVFTARLGSDPPVNRTVGLGPGETTVAILAGLPVGVVTLTQDVFTVPCAMIPSRPPTWVSDPVTVTLRPGTTVDVLFMLRRADAAGQVNARSDFPAFRPAMSEFPLPTAASTPYAIALGPDGNLWFTQRDRHKIGRITSAGAITEFPLAAGSSPTGIVAGPDGCLWFAMVAKIGRITPTGAIREFPIADGARAHGITLGPDANLWFTGVDRSSVYRLIPGGDMRPTLVAEGPRYITAGEDGALWFTSDRFIGRVTIDGRYDASFGLPGRREPRGITWGPDGAIWFAVVEGFIGRLTPADAGITLFPLGANRYPEQIVVGPDAALWFTELGTGAIGRLAPVAGGGVTIAEFLTPLASQPHGLALGTDSALWYTDLENRIGRARP
jgi:virginiamycin B lyase